MAIVVIVIVVCTESVEACVVGAGGAGPASNRSTMLVHTVTRGFGLEVVVHGVILKDREGNSVLVWVRGGEGTTAVPSCTRKTSEKWGHNPTILAHKACLPRLSTREGDRHSCGGRGDVGDAAVVVGIVGVVVCHDGVCHCVGVRR